MLTSLQSYKDFLLSTFAKITNSGKISVEQYNAAKDIVDSYPASWLASDTSDIVSLSDSLYQAMQSGSLSDINIDVKNDIVSLLTQVKTSIGNQEGYGMFAAAKSQATEVALQAGQAAESVASDIADMSIPYAIVGGVLGVVAAPLLVATVPLATVTVPVFGAVAGYSSKKLQNAAEGLRNTVKGWF